LEVPRAAHASVRERPEIVAHHLRIFLDQEPLR
jgi:hypothetical protein